LFLGIGVDPEQEIIKALITVIEEYSIPLAIALRVIVAVGALWVSIKLWLAIYAYYGYIGLFSAAFVFIGIILLVADISAGIGLLLIGIATGAILPNNPKDTR
jgi:hypothetical protein